MRAKSLYSLHYREHVNDSTRHRRRSYNGFVRVPRPACVVCLISFLDTKVILTAGGSDNQDQISVTVGSPRYIRETISPDATLGHGIDPVIRGLVSSAEDDTAGQAGGDLDEASGAISVRVHVLRETATLLTRARYHDLWEHRALTCSVTEVRRVRVFGYEQVRSTGNIGGT